MMMRFLTSLLLCLAATAQAVELIAPVKVEVTANSAVVSWKTDVACGTRLNYGTQPTSLDQKIEGEVTDAHRVEITGLRTGTTYYYNVGSARQKLCTGSFVPAVGSPGNSAALPLAPGGKKSLLDRVLDVITPETAPAPSVRPKTVLAPTTAARPPPPTRQTWGNLGSLQDHYDRHGGDFQSRDPDDYAAKAWLFLQRAKTGEVPMKWDAADETLRVFDPRTRAFAAYNRDGTTKTYFRPNNPSYWDRQPGRPIKPSELRF